MVDDPTFRDSLIRSLRPLFISMTEKLVAQGTVGSELFILARGALAAYVDTNIAHAAPAPKELTAADQLADSNVLVSEVEAGNPSSCVGEVSLLADLGCKKMRSATVIAQSHCELYSFAGANFNDLIGDFPKAKAVFFKLAKERLARSQKIRDQKAREDRLRQSQGSVKAMQFGNKLLSLRSIARDAGAEAEGGKATTGLGGLLRYHQEPELTLSPEEKVALRLDKLEAKLERLTELVVGGVDELKASLRKGA